MVTMLQSMKHTQWLSNKHMTPAWLQYDSYLIYMITSCCTLWNTHNDHHITTWLMHDYSMTPIRFDYEQSQKWHKYHKISTWFKYDPYMYCGCGTEITYYNHISCTWVLSVLGMIPGKTSCNNCTLYTKHVWFGYDSYVCCVCITGTAYTTNKLHQITVC